MSKSVRQRLMTIATGGGLSSSAAQAGSAIAASQNTVPNGVFGLPIESVVAAQGIGRSTDSPRAHRRRSAGSNVHQIPKVIVDCVEWLRDTPDALEEPGIFRIPGQASEVAALRDMYANPKLDVDIPRTAEVASVASLLKLYFRELPYPPIPLSSYAAFVAAVKAFPDDRQAVRTKLHSLIQELGGSSSAVLEYLIEFLAEVAAYQDVNQMTPENLSICWAPNLLRPPESTTVANSMFDTEYVNAALCILLEDIEVMREAQQRHRRRTEKMKLLLQQKSAVSAELESGEAARNLKHLDTSLTKDSSTLRVEGEGKTGRSLQRSISGRQVQTMRKALAVSADDTSTAKAPDENGRKRTLRPLQRSRSSTSSSLSTSAADRIASDWDYDHRAPASGSVTLAVSNDSRPDSDRRSEKENLKALAKRMFKDSQNLILARFEHEGECARDTFQGQAAIDYLLSACGEPSHESACIKLEKMIKYRYILRVYPKTGEASFLEHGAAQVFRFNIKHGASGRQLNRCQSDKSKKGEKGGSLKFVAGSTGNIRKAAEEPRQGGSVNLSNLRNAAAMLARGHDHEESSYDGGTETTSVPSPLLTISSSAGGTSTGALELLDSLSQISDSTAQSNGGMPEVPTDLATLAESVDFSDDAAAMRKYNHHRRHSEHKSEQRNRSQNGNTRDSSSRHQRKVSENELQPSSANVADVPAQHHEPARRQRRSTHSHISSRLKSTSTSQLPDAI